MIIAICSSANFYKQAISIQQTLEEKGYQVLIPDTAKKMKESGDFNVENYKTWFGNPGDYHKKSDLMRRHFAEIEKSDAILVLNFEKNGKQNYIGPNVLMEMALAFWLKKPIYVLNDLPNPSLFEEELKGFQPVILDGNLELIEN